MRNFDIIFKKGNNDTLLVGVNFGCDCWRCEYNEETGGGMYCPGYCCPYRFATIDTADKAILSKHIFDTNYRVVGYRSPEGDIREGLYSGTSFPEFFEKLEQLIANGAFN